MRQLLRGVALMAAVTGGMAIEWPMPLWAASVPQVTHLAAHGPNGVQPVGTTLTYTATADGNGGPVEYQFWEESPTGWQVVQNYSLRNTLTIPDAAAGSYPVVVNAMTMQQIQAGDWSQALHQTLIANVGSQVSLSAPSGSVSANTTVTLQAAATHLLAPVYQFWYETPSGKWVGSNYSASNTFTFHATTTGIYRTIVYAKDLMRPIRPNFRYGARWRPCR